jgi:TetR/AcrR family transcriptional regulator
MERDEVVENQRQRMHGAMVEAVAAHGYGGTSVKQVISLAGVSRRAFYEQFANKQECFLSTLDLLAARAQELISDSYRSADGDLEDRMRAALQTLAQLLADNPKSAHMALVGAPAAGAGGWSRLTRTLLGFERMLADSFARNPGGAALPASVVRGIVGGLHMMVFTRLRQHRSHELPELAEEMLRWTLAAHSPLAEQMRTDRMRRSSPHARPTVGRPSGPGFAADTTLATQPSSAVAPQQGSEAQRMRLLDSALEMIALEGYGNLSPLRIVDRAEVSIDTFFNLFGDMDGCVLVALANLSEEVRETLATANLRSRDGWPLAVRRAVHSLMQHFAERPSHAHMIATGAFEMGSPGIDLSLELARDLARAITAEAPSTAASALVEEGIAGALWHTVYCHAACQKTEMLPAAADHLTYLLLAPFMGAERAIEALADRHGARDFARAPERIHRPRASAAGAPAAL